MLDVRIHDKYQIEFKTHYRFKKSEKSTAYALEIYVFASNSLDLNPGSYPKYLFYRDLQTYLRLETPKIALRHIVSGRQNPFENLAAGFQDLASDPSIPQYVDNYVNQLKMFCCVTRRAMSEHIALVSRKTKPGSIDRLVEKYLSHSRNILQQYRSLRACVSYPSSGRRSFNLYIIIDEYRSLFTEEYSYRLLNTLKKKGLANWDAHKKAILELIVEETDYRKSQGYLVAASENDSNERLVHQTQSLKKYTESVLFLKTRSRQEGKLAQQMIFGVAAGLAMIWATAVALYAQYKFGIFTMAFFLTLVGSYILKDRIKELVKEYLSNKLLRFFYDQKIKICTTARKNRIGASRESFSFVNDEGLDNDIMELRNRDEMSQLGEYSVGEQVILYRKKIEVFQTQFDQVYKDLKIKGVTDITRYSVARMTQKMGNPKRQLYITDGEDYKRISARKVHHINFIIRYSENGKSNLKRFRLVMDRGGIRRLEEVSLAS